MNPNPYIAIVTTTYNMADTIYRTYESISAQTYHNFYWLIIDNGSTDNTKHIIDSILKNSNIKIQYVYKNHGIRATAINAFIEIVDSDLVVEIHADDQLTPDALELFVNAWDRIPADNKDLYFNVCSHCISSETKEIIGKVFPYNANSYKIAKKLAMNTVGEKHYCVNTKCLKEFSIPILSDKVSYITEAALWMPLQRKYMTYFINEYTRVYFVDSNNSYSYSPPSKVKYINSYYSNMYLLNNIFLGNKFPIEVWFKYLLFLVYQSLMSDIKFSEVFCSLSSIVDKIIMSLSFFPIFLFSKNKKRKLSKHNESWDVT